MNYGWETHFYPVYKAEVLTLLICIASAKVIRTGIRKLSIKNPNHHGDCYIFMLAALFLRGLKQFFAVKLKPLLDKQNTSKWVKSPETHTYQRFNYFRGQTNTRKGFQPFLPFFCLSPANQS
jgi:hypothetical protein